MLALDTEPLKKLRFACESTLNRGARSKWLAAVIRIEHRERFWATFREADVEHWMNNALGENCYVASPQKQSPAIIELENVSLSFGRETLLKEINLSIAKGESFVLIGPSGQGKSSVLKLMAGLIAPTSGKLLIQGRDWHTMRSSEQDPLIRKMGMLFQKNALFDSMTSGENVGFPLREVAGASDKEIAEAIRYYLDAVGILHAENLFPDEISGGMQKRLGIARALALKPEIVFYDDPTAGLDPITSRKIIRLIKDLQKQMQTTVIAVTNDMNRADQMADRIGMVVGSELLICGSPEETKKHPDPRVQQFIRGSLQGPLTDSLADSLPDSSAAQT